MSAATALSGTKPHVPDTRWRVEPKLLVALAGLLIGLGSGYWGRELISQTQQERRFADVREEIAATRMSVVALEAKMLEMRLQVNEDTDSRIRRESEEYRRDVQRLEVKLDAISEQIVEVKLRVGGLAPPQSVR
ncbi:MAG: hypothetical protein ABIH04_09035 [Planctomycetota bacterium]